MIDDILCRGGMKESGIGRENGLEALEACEQTQNLSRIVAHSSRRTRFFYTDSQSKSTIVNISTAEESRKRDDWFAEGAAAAKRYG